MPDQDKPSPVTLNLDTLEHEDAKEPFVVVHGGKRVTFLDAMEIDWKDLLAILQDPARFFDVALTKKDAEAFFATPLPIYKLNPLVEEYLKHFGIDPGNPVGSSAS